MPSSSLGIVIFFQDRWDLTQPDSYLHPHYFTTKCKGDSIYLTSHLMLAWVLWDLNNLPQIKDSCNRRHLWAKCTDQMVQCQTCLLSTKVRHLKCRCLRITTLRMDLRPSQAIVPISLIQSHHSCSVLHQRHIQRIKLHLHT
jgi:hypothetical protein